MAYSPDKERLAVQLGPADSIFPAILSDAWRRRGWRVAVVSNSPRSHWLPDDVPVLGLGAFRGELDRLPRRLARGVLRRVEHVLVAANRRRFRRATGKDEPAVWERQVIDCWAGAPALAHLALSLRPAFVLAHDAAAYGPALAYCRGVPRVLFPWGSDIYNTPESWPGAGYIIGRAIRAADLVVPSSASAANHIVMRFRVPAEKVRAISWGIELDQCRRAAGDGRTAMFAKWGVPPGAIVVQNCRKFWPHFGCFTVLEGFMKVAAGLPQCHFVLLGGIHSDELHQAAQRIAAAGLAHRFTIVERELSLAEYLELASISDVSVSLCPRGDARSVSVLQLAAAGAAPLISEDREYRTMETFGFAASFFDPASADALAAGICQLVENPALRQEMRERNEAYLRHYEDRRTQMDRLLSAIEALLDVHGNPSR